MLYRKQRKLCFKSKNVILNRKTVSFKHMVHYNTFMQVLRQQNIVLQQCKIDQIISNDSVLAYQVNADLVCNIDFTMSSQEKTVYIFVDQRANCNVRFFEQDGCDRFNLKLHVILGQNAQYFMNFSFVNTLNVECSISVYLEGDQAKAEIKGLYALNRDQKVAIKTYQYHCGVDTWSNLVIKGMLTGEAQASYHGLIKIDESAKRADASQENKNIVLSTQARVVSVPSIEVLQHDVQCCHGSAIGKFDQAHIWYLQSKGIEESQAQKLLIRSFFQDVLTESNNKDEVVDALCRKMS